MLIIQLLLWFLGTRELTKDLDRHAENAREWSPPVLKVAL